jgi:succinyl-CoA synthetase beta subunit
MCGNTLVTKQTGEDGIKCNCVYIVEKIEIEKEFYLSITLDRAAGMPVIIYSKEGGMAIEDVAHATPEKIHKIHINVDTGMDLDSLI